MHCDISLKISCDTHFNLISTEAHLTTQEPNFLLTFRGNEDDLILRTEHGKC